MNGLDATGIAEAVGSGAITPALVAEHFLARIGVDEPDIQAFVSFDAEAVREQALQLEGCSGPLAGLPVGVKDIFDTADHPTEF